MDSTREVLNQFLTKSFNQILFSEEEYLSQKLGTKITLKAVHTLEAVREAEKENNTTVSAISSKLSTTAGTLSVALKRLEKDGYILRTQNTTDKRIFFITLTPAGKKVLKVHDEYHKKMVDTIAGNLSKKEEADLVDLLSKIKYFFS
jgi:DNA-binding MarR family transcriptional regulator